MWAIQSKHRMERSPRELDSSSFWRDVASRLLDLTSLALDVGICRVCKEGRHTCSVGKTDVLTACLASCICDMECLGDALDLYIHIA